MLLEDLLWANVPNENVIQLWNSGLGENYRAAADGPLHAAMLNQPRRRADRYLVRGFIDALAFLACASSLGLFTWFITCFPKTPIGAICLGAFIPALLVGLIMLLSGARYLYAYAKLRQAICGGEDTDLSDPLRISIMRAATEWGMDHGLVVRLENGHLAYRRKDGEAEDRRFLS